MREPEPEAFRSSTTQTLESLIAANRTFGTVYADPYGHLLIIAKRVPQTDGNAGVFLAVDAQPDGTVSRKRFWRGNFLFAQEPALGDAGFKRFRPIVRDKNGSLRRLTAAQVAKNPKYADFSLEGDKVTGLSLAYCGGAPESGTSMASPHVAGAAALCLGRAPGRDPAAIKRCILEHASLDKLGAIGPGSPNRLVYTREP